MKKPVFGMVAALAPLFTFAATSIYWVGPQSGGKLSELANWANADGSQASALASNTAVFTNEAPLSIVDDRHYGSDNLNSIRVERGNVYFCKNGSSRSYTYLNNSPTIYVAEGAVFSCTNDFAAAHGGSKFTKTGSGVFELHGSLDSPGTFNPTTVSEGTMRLVADADADAALKSKKVIVKNGATLEVCSKGDKAFYIYDNKGGHAPLELEAGSTLRLLGGKCNLTGVTGAGAIEAPGDVASYLVFRNEPNELPEFTGTLNGNLFIGGAAGSSNRFAVNGTDDLVGIRGLHSTDGIVFKGGVGEFHVNALDGAQSGTITLADADGVPLTFRTALVNGSKLSFAGAGNLIVTNSTTVCGSNYKATGVLAVEGTHTLTLGDTKAEHDFDYSGAAPSEIRYDDDATLTLSIGADVDVRIPVVGNGNLRVHSAYRTVRTATFHDLRNRAGTTGPISSFGTVNSGRWNLAGGTAVLPASLIGGGGADARERVLAGSWHGVVNKTPIDPLRTLRQPSAVSVSGSSGWNSITVTGGEFFSSLGSGLKDLHLRGGVAWIESGAYPASSDGTQKDGGRSQILLDGGAAYVPFRSADSDVTFLNKGYASTTWLCVGERGGRLRAVWDRPGEANSFLCDCVFEIATNTVTTGQLDIEHSGTIAFSKPMQLNGPVRILDGTYQVAADAIAGDGTATGTGRLRLLNATLYPYDKTTSLALSVPGGLDFEGGALVNLSSTKHHVLSVGSLTRTGPGSALFVHTSDTSLPFGQENGPKFIVTGGLENDEATGALKMPVFIATGNAQRYAEFAKYDADKGVVPFDGYITSLADADATKILKLSSSVQLPANSTTCVGGLCFTQTSWANVNFGDGAVLKLGNGTDPAVLLMNVCGALNGAKATLDFGGSEGLFYVPTSHQGDAPAINVKLTGSNGVSYFCVNRAHDQKVSVNNANTYTGGTRVWGVDLYAANAEAFAEGDVYVGGGWARGGRVILNKEGATFENAFHLAGRGNSHTTDSEPQKGRLYQNYRKGALSFAKNATVSGPVELVEETRITAADEVKGTISGVVSGDRLQIYKPFADYDAGVVALTSANTYTGGTEVISATLELAAASGAGTGKVMLDNATLQFANATPIAFANAIGGAGKVRLCGAGVDFTGDITDLSAPKLELTGGAYDFTAALPFATVENVSGKARITLKAPGAYDLSAVSFVGKIQLNLEAGATIDLRGGTLDIYQFRGDRSAVNGTVNTQIPDYLGMSIIIR